MTARKDEESVLNEVMYTKIELATITDISKSIIKIRFIQKRDT